MSWRDKVQTQLIITTGDGQVFTPLWNIKSAQEVEFNLAQFDFPNIKGSKIDRGTRMARKFVLDIYFQGDNYLNDARKFEQSSNDSRPWTIQHPIYGIRSVQPVGLKFDYSAYNVAQITGTLLETMDNPALTIIPAPIHEIELKQANIKLKLATTFAQAPLKTSNVNKLSTINSQIYKLGLKCIKLTQDAGQLFNLLNSANSAISNLLGDAQFAMTTMQGVIEYPFKVVNSISVRMSTLSDQFNYLSSSVSTLLGVADKKSYEAVAGTTLASMCVCSVTSYDSTDTQVTDGQLPDYDNRTDVLNIIIIIQNIYNQYLIDLDAMQTANGGLEDSYMPDADAILALDDLIKYTIANLTIIALSAKQERTIVLEKDTNVVLLAHRLYGLAQDDSTIDTLIKNNKIYLNEILQLSKGRSIVYYV